MLQTISDLSDLKYYGKKVLMRVDFNVSLKNGIIGEDYRIRMAIPTIEYLTKRGAKLILMSHVGRPTHSDINYSLEPVAKRLSEIMPTNNVRFAADCTGSVVQSMLQLHLIGSMLQLMVWQDFLISKWQDSTSEEKLNTFLW